MITLLGGMMLTINLKDAKAGFSRLVGREHRNDVGIDAYAAALAGQLKAKAISAGHDPGMANATIAGIAKAHDLMILTHNKRHFLLFSVAVATPDEASANTR